MLKSIESDHQPVTIADASDGIWDRLIGQQTPAEFASLAEQAGETLEEAVTGAVADAAEQGAVFCRGAREAAVEALVAQIKKSL